VGDWTRLMRNVEVALGTGVAVEYDEDEDDG
jgi:hypothetical protein